jgi:serine/threonine protein kinase
VFRCVDREGDGKEVAIKVVRNVKRYTESAEVEARILTLVNKADPGNESHCVRFYSTFNHGDHLCMVFELLGPSVYDYLKRNRYKPLPLYCVQAFADQLCWAIAYLHALDLTHTDLKPENLLLMPTTFVETSARTYTRQSRTVLAPQSTVMKRASMSVLLGQWCHEVVPCAVIDFGGATFEHQRKSTIIQTRQYRAPEVTLNAGWDTASDMWSVGCILMEMYTGELLFQTVSLLCFVSVDEPFWCYGDGCGQHDNLEHLALIEKCLGPIPESMTRSSEARKYYERGRLLHTRLGSRESLKHVAKMKPLRVTCHSGIVSASVVLMFVNDGMCGWVLVVCRTSFTKTTPCFTTL